MAYVLVAGAALFVAVLTLFSGFGLGTLLLPVFALFFPIPAAVSAVAVVHLANNLFRVFLVGRKADPQVLLRFAVPGAVTAAAGATLLLNLAELSPLFTYSLAGREVAVSPLATVIAGLIALFALFDLLPSLNRLGFDRRFLVLGGCLSGFFGGLSGHQGALRSAFLIKAGLEKEAFVGTAVLSAVVVDVTRLLIYGFGSLTAGVATLGSAGESVAGLVTTAMVAAFAGSFLGAKLMKQATMNAVKQLVGAMLLLVAVLLGSGII